jgi:hypothetical protein
MVTEGHFVFPCLLWVGRHDGLTVRLVFMNCSRLLTRMTTQYFLIKLRVCLALLAVFWMNWESQAEEQKGPVAAAYREVKVQIPEANDLLAKGKWTEAVRMLTSVHPEEKRTIDQSQALATFLFHLHPEESYRLHKAVAEARPDQELPNYLWAVEQHRRGEWKGALKSYQTASKLVDDFAPTYGLAAECALRLGIPKGNFGRV